MLSLTNGFRCFDNGDDDDLDFDIEIVIEIDLGTDIGLLF